MNCLAERVENVGLMPNFGEQLQRLRKARHLSRAELGTLAGVTERQIYAWEQLAGPNIRGSNYRKLAEALGLSTADLDREWRASTIDQSVGDPVRRGIPLINKAPAGNIVNYDEAGCDSGQGRWYVPREGVQDPHAFAVSIVGDSMNKTFMPGDIAIFSPMDTDGAIHFGRVKISDGHIMFIRFGSDAPCEGCTVARVYREQDGGVRVEKENRKYPPMKCRPEQIAGMSALIRTIRDALPGMTDMFFATGQLEQPGAKEGQVFPDYDGPQAPPTDE